MPNPKRIIPVSEVDVGDSFRIGGVSGTFFVYDRWHDDKGRLLLSTLTPSDDHRAFIASRDPDAPASVGYTNRKAKRARGKMARRARFAERDAAIGESVMRASASWCDEADFLQAQTDRLAASISPAEDAAIIRGTFIAGRT